MPYCCTVPTRFTTDSVSDTRHTKTVYNYTKTIRTLSGRFPSAARTSNTLKRFRFDEGRLCDQRVKKESLPCPVASALPAPRPRAWLPCFARLQIHHPPASWHVSPRRPVRRRQHHPQGLDQRQTVHLLGRSRAERARLGEERRVVCPRTPARRTCRPTMLCRLDSAPDPTENRGLPSLGPAFQDIRGTMSSALPSYLLPTVCRLSVQFFYGRSIIEGIPSRVRIPTDCV